jgi:hypothetical protein
VVTGSPLPLVYIPKAGDLTNEFTQVDHGTSVFDFAKLLRSDAVVLVRELCGADFFVPCRTD